MKRPIAEPCSRCEARAAEDALRRSTHGRPGAATQFARTVLVAQDFAVRRGAERVEAEDLRRAAEHVRREVAA